MNNFLTQITLILLAAFGNGFLVHTFKIIFNIRKITNEHSRFKMQKIQSYFDPNTNGF